MKNGLLQKQLIAYYCHMFQKPALQTVKGLFTSSVPPRGNTVLRGMLSEIAGEATTSRVQLVKKKAAQRKYLRFIRQS